jgi:hypothetical protein
VEKGRDGSEKTILELTKDVQVLGNKLFDFFWGAPWPRSALLEKVSLSNLQNANKT